jgi:hypothetical protein
MTGLCSSGHVTYMPLHHRWRTRAVLHDSYGKRDLEHYIDIMEEIYNTLPKVCFVWALIDSPEQYRMEAFLRFREGCRQEYDELTSMIVALQEKNEVSVQGISFQCVAVSEYTRALPSSAQRCSSCKEKIPESADIIWRLCQKHTLCLACYKYYSSRSLNPAYSCRCITPEAVE